ncbi:MAG TPA: cytochrome C oxidase subunit I [Burkholderiaceae bacterium]
MENDKQQNQPTERSSDRQKKSGRIKMLLILAVCIAPVVASYFTYYVIKPSARTNYGELIDPAQHPMPQLGATTLDGKAMGLDAYKGKWILLEAAGGKCDDACRDKLLVMRQERLMQGKEMDRIERVWLITDDEPLDTMLMREYDDTRMLRVKPEVLEKWLPVAQGGAISDGIYVIDPLGNLMMRFPKSAEPPKAGADEKEMKAYRDEINKEHAKIKKDITKLLTASSIG